MPSARRTIIIDRPVEEVFAFFTTPSNDSKWRRHVKEISASGPLETGSRIHQVVQGPGGRGIQADIEVTALEPPSRYAFKAVTGPVLPEGEFRMAAAGGSTEVTLSLSAELSGLKKLAMSRSVQNAMDSEVAGLDAAKRVLEGQ